MEIALVLVAVPLIGVPVGAVFGQVALVLVDIALIRAAIRAILRQVFLVLPNVLLVALNILLLGGRILGVSAGGKQTGKRHREHASTNQEFCLHFSLLVKNVPGVTTTLGRSNTSGAAKFREAAARLLLTDRRVAFAGPNYWAVNDLWTESRTPFTNAPESSEENFFASSTASFSTTLAGVSAEL